MTKLAIYEKNEGKDALLTNRYYRSDFIGKKMIRNFWVSTFGYLLLVVIVALDHIEWLMEKMDSLNFILLIFGLVASYLCFLALYSAIVYMMASDQYEQAEKSTKQYAWELGKLLKLYQQEEQRRKGSYRRKKS